MDDLKEQIAQNAAQHALDRYFAHLPPVQRLPWYRRFYDAALASMIAYEDLKEARRDRYNTMASEN